MNEEYSPQPLNSSQEDDPVRDIKWVLFPVFNRELLVAPDVEYNDPIPPSQERYSHLPILRGDKPKGKKEQVIRCSCHAAQDF